MGVFLETLPIMAIGMMGIFSSIMIFYFMIRLMTEKL